jgi:hypothetical protein
MIGAMLRGAQTFTLVAVGLAAACSSSSRPAPEASTPEARIAALRFEVASNPKNRAAHRELARLYRQTDRPGAALRHYQGAGAAVRGDERRAVARLYLARAQRRLELGDLHAYADLERVAALDIPPVEMDRELVRRALYAAALAAFRRGDPPGIAAGRGFLDRARAAFGPDPRLAARAPGSAGVDEVGEAAAWLADGNARRTARDLYATYRARGGQGPAHRRRWLELERWWRGSAASSPVLEAGIDSCALAYTPGDLDCRGELDGATATRAAYERAHRFSWQLRGVTAAASLLPAALESWLDGERAGWLREVGAVIEPDSIDAADIDTAAPIWARASLWRMSADAPRAAAAIERALAGDDPLTDRQVAVVIAEAAAQGRPLESLRPIATGELGWRALARAARARALRIGDASFERELLAGAPMAWRRAHHRALGDLGPLSALGDDLALSAIARLNRAAPRLGRLAAARWKKLGWSGGRRSAAVQIVSIGGLDPARLAADVGLPDQVAALSRIARAHGRDPALGERLAADWLDGAITALERGPALVELFARAGDPGRADRFARRVLDETPEHPGALATAAETAAALGDSRRAMTLMILAAARSGDAGATARRLTHSFLAAGATAAALEAGSWALSLTPPGEDVELLELLARALLTRDRRANAVETLDRLRRRLGSDERVNRILEAGGAPLPVRPRADFADSIEAAAWNPGHPELLASALASKSPPPWIEPQLAALALGADTPRARRAMHLWAAQLGSDSRLAAGLEREAQRLPR